MNRRLFLAVVPMGLVGRAAVAAVEGSDDPRFVPTIAGRIGGVPVRLVLTGSAIRKKYGFSVYAVASYVQEGAAPRDAEGLSRADIAKQLHLIFERDVDGATIGQAFRTSIGMSYPAPAFASELARLERYFLPGGAKHGDHIWLTHIPGVGLGCLLVGRPGIVIEGVGFAQAAWGTYLGRRNLGVAIRSGLTSRL